VAFSPLLFAPVTVPVFIVMTTRQSVSLAIFTASVSRVVADVRLELFNVTVHTFSREHVEVFCFKQDFNLLPEKYVSLVSALYDHFLLLEHLHLLSEASQFLLFLKGKWLFRFFDRLIRNLLQLSWLVIPLTDNVFDISWIWEIVRELLLGSFIDELWTNSCIVIDQLAFGVLLMFVQRLLESFAVSFLEVYQGFIQRANHLI
jgi:hypothetical protein